jgi:hypothetical protein
MRGFLQPGVKPVTTESQAAFTKLSRGRRTKLAKGAETTLVKADQWAHGGAVKAEIAEALERQLKALQSKKK